MVDNNASSDQNEQIVTQYKGPEPMRSSRKANRFGSVIKYTVISISLATLIIITSLFVSFLYGWHGPLYALGLLSLFFIPFVLIGGSIYCGIKGRWISLGLGIVILPPAWVITLLGCMSDLPWNPSDIQSHIFHAAFLIMGTFACWLFLTLTFWQSRPTAADQKPAITEENEIMGEKQNSNYGIVALVAGIVGILFSYFFSLGIFPAIVALLCGIQARKKGQKYAEAGINLGKVGIIVNILISIMFFVFSSIY